MLFGISILTLRCATHEKGPYVFCRQRRSRSACTSVQPNLGIFSLSTYTTVSTHSVSRQRRPRSACAYAQADQGLCCPHITKGPFLCFAHHMNYSSGNSIEVRVDSLFTVTLGHQNFIPYLCRDFKQGRLTTF